MFLGKWKLRSNYSHKPKQSEIDPKIPKRDIFYKNSKYLKTEYLCHNNSINGNQKEF